MKELQDKLNRCETVAQMLTLLLTEYTVDVKPGPIIRPLIISGLVQAAQMLSLKKKQ